MAGFAHRVSSGVGAPLACFLVFAGCGPAARGTGPQSAGSMLVVAPESGAERGPGHRVESPEDEALCASAVAAVVGGDIDAASDLFADSIVVGPALWALLQDDPSVAGVGIPTTMHIPTGDHVVVLDGRSFVEPDRMTLLKSARLREVLARVSADGAPRAATDLERDLFYMLIPFEISGEPVTVIGDGATLTVVDSADERVFWLDVLGAYGASDAPTAADACAGGSVEACREVGSELLQAGRMEDAEAPLRQACSAGDLPACGNLSVLYVMTGRAAEGEEPARKACSGGLIGACANLGMVLGELARPAEALEACRPACDAGDAAGCANASWYALLSGDAAAAEVLARKSLELHPGDGPARVNLGHALLLQGVNDAALAEYDQALASDGERHTAILSDLNDLEPLFPNAAAAIAAARAHLPPLPADAGDPGPAVMIVPPPATPP